MDPKHHDYLHYAEHCEAMAAQSSDPEIQQGWLNLAREWLQLIPGADLHGVGARVTLPFERPV